MEVAQDAVPANGSFGLVVISHGAGGGSLNHRDLAMALASNGYVAAAPTHPRGQYNDISGISVWIGRPKQISGVIDALLMDKELGPHIQPERIGIAGHSNGSDTALVVAGVKPSTAAAIQHCIRYHREDAKFCSYGGAATRKTTEAAGELPDLRDPRVRAVVLMAPKGALFTDEALSKLAVPVRIYGAEHDDLTPVRYHAERLAQALPSQATYVLIKGAGHFSFIASFPAALRIWVGEAGQDPEGFDRDAVHETLNRDIVVFLDQKLRSSAAEGGRPESQRSSCLSASVLGKLRPRCARGRAMKPRTPERWHRGCKNTPDRKFTESK
jgi:predicted dienelactone hydrolase